MVQLHSDYETEYSLIPIQKWKERIWSQIETRYFSSCCSSPHLPFLLFRHIYRPPFLLHHFPVVIFSPISLFHCIKSRNESESDIKMSPFLKGRTEGYQTLNGHHIQTPNQIITSIIIITYNVHPSIIIRTLRKSGKKGALHTVHRIFFAPTYMTLGNGFKTLNIDNKVSWNIQKHIFIILKSKFEPFLDGQKIFPEGVLFTRSPRRPEKCHRLKNITRLRHYRENHRRRLVPYTLCTDRYNGIISRICVA